MATYGLLARSCHHLPLVICVIDPSLGCVIVHCVHRPSSGPRSESAPSATRCGQDGALLTFDQIN
eukprot:2563580-Pleurochrysis_carterae.AAC.3